MPAVVSVLSPKAWPIPKTIIGSATPVTYAVSPATRLSHAAPIMMKTMPAISRCAFPNRRVRRGRHSATASTTVVSGRNARPACSGL